MKLNILVLGKSGAGKSSLLNYLWGEKVAATGTGRPVTPKSKGRATGLYEHAPIQIQGHQLAIFDSWGLEADHAEEWTQLISEEIQKREKSPALEDWFHAVIYCISAAGARIEPFEIEKIIKPLADQGQAVTFALTKSDLATPDTIAALEEAVCSAYPNHGGIVRLCSESKTLRSGVTTEKQGKEQLTATLINNLSVKLRKKLSTKYLEKCRDACGQWKEIALGLYDTEAGFFQSTGTTLEKISSNVGSALNDLLRRVDKWMHSSLDDVKATEIAFGSVLNTGIHRAIDGSAVFSSRKIEWDTSDYWTSFVMHLIPGLNIAYVFIAKSLHRDMLEDKLEAAVQNVEREARARMTSLLVVDEKMPMKQHRLSTERPESTIRIRRLLAGTASD